MHKSSLRIYDYVSTIAYLRLRIYDCVSTIAQWQSTVPLHRHTKLIHPHPAAKND
jgi:hypothetical protein